MSDYEVGFGKPPRKTRWKKGESGNPKGSKKKKEPQPLLDELAEQLTLPINVTVKGKTITMPFAEALATGMMRKILQEPVRLQMQFLVLAERLGLFHRHQLKLEELNDERPYSPSVEDQRIIEIALRMASVPEDSEQGRQERNWDHGPKSCVPERRLDDAGGDELDLGNGVISSQHREGRRGK